MINVRRCQEKIILCLLVFYFHIKDGGSMVITRLTCLSMLREGGVSYQSIVGNLFNGREKTYKRYKPKKSKIGWIATKCRIWIKVIHFFFGLIRITVGNRVANYEPRDSIIDFLRSFTWFRTRNLGAFNTYLLVPQHFWSSYGQSCRRF